MNIASPLREARPAIHADLTAEDVEAPALPPRRPPCVIDALRGRGRWCIHKRSAVVVLRQSRKHGDDGACDCVASGGDWRGSMNIIELKPARKQTRATRRISSERPESAAVISLHQATGLDHTSHVGITIDALGNLRLNNNINPAHADMMTDALLLVLGRARRARLDWRPIRHNCDYGPPTRPAD